MYVLVNKSNNNNVKSKTKSKQQKANAKGKNKNVPNDGDRWDGSPPHPKRTEEETAVSGLTTCRKPVTTRNYK